jgi:hypothetical protein
MAVEEDIGGLQWLCFHRITPRAPLNLLNYSTRHRSGGHQPHTCLMHLVEQGFPVRADKIHIVELHNRPPTGCGGSGGAPTLPQFLHPKARQLALQLEPQFLGIIVDRNLKHAVHNFRLQTLQKRGQHEVFAKSTR